MKQALTERFEPIEQTEHFHTAFRCRMERDRGRLLDFAIAILTLASRAFPKMTLPQNVLAHDQSIYGLPDDDRVSSTS